MELPEQTAIESPHEQERLYVHIKHIHIGLRFREDLGDIKALADDIKKNGLYNDILVTFSKEGIKEPYTLISGERRLTALQVLKWEYIPVKVDKRNLDSHQTLTMELQENLMRKEMTPDEEAVLVAKIHEQYINIHGEKQNPKQKTGHGKQDTARLLNYHPNKVRHALEHAAMRDKISELKTAKTRSEAQRLINATKERLRLEERARKLDIIEAKEPKTDRRIILRDRFIKKDFFEGIENISDNIIDFVELDPDWGISFTDRGGADETPIMNDYKEISPDDYQIRLAEILMECYRVMKDHAWLICWYSIEKWHDTTRAILEEIGFKVCPMPAFWIKETGNTATPAYRLGEGVETFFYARKGVPRIINMGRNNTYHYRTPKRNERIHPAEKPVELYEDILKTFIRDRSMILSGFLGRGNIIKAAENLNMTALGFDTSEVCKNAFDADILGWDGFRKFKTYKDL